MSALLVLVAHNGKTLQLEVHPTTRVDAVQQALVSFTKIPVSDQIVMCQGVRLDPSRPLSAYKLPVVNPAEAEDHPVFLYNKSFLRPGHPGPVPEVLPPLQVNVPAPSPVPPHHPLHTASSPLARALPDYERQFQHHLLVGQAHWDAGQKRIQRSRQLLSEQEVQARAADAARANVEAHYTYILTSYQDFLDRYSAQHQAHSQLLASTQEALNMMASIELQPAVQTDRWRRLIDLVPQQKLTERHDSCRRSHEQFAAKVAELQDLFNTLKADVEALFLQAPSVDLDQLGQRLADMDRLTDEESSILQGLSADLKKIQALVEDTVRQLGANALSTTSIHDACGAMETINESHVQQLLPRLADCDRTLEGFGGTCVEAKLRMTQDVVEQLQRISAQQSKIRDMKNKLAAYLEVLQRQQEGFAELRHVHKLPAAYRYALAECLRRKAWGEVFSSQAAKLAEHMGKLREKEVAKREGFQRQVERIIPVDLLARMGLLREPPHCQISAPAADPQLLHVTPQDVQRVPTDKAAHAAFLSGDNAGPSGSQETGNQGRAEDAGEVEGTEGQAPNLEMENSKLRADLATQIALNCLNELRAPTQEPARAGPSKAKEGEGKQEDSKAADAGPSDPGSSKKATRSESEALALLQRALNSKDAYAAKLEQTNTTLATSLSKYEKRIAQLEALVQSYSQQLESGQQQGGISRALSGGAQVPADSRPPPPSLAQSTILLVNLPAGEGPLPPLGPTSGPPSPALPPGPLWTMATQSGAQQHPPANPQDALQPDPVLPAAQLLGGHTPPGAYSTIITQPIAASMTMSALATPLPTGLATPHDHGAMHPHPHTWTPSHAAHLAPAHAQDPGGGSGGPSSSAEAVQGQVAVPAFPSIGPTISESLHEDYSLPVPEVAAGQTDGSAASEMAAALSLEPGHGHTDTSNASGMVTVPAPEGQTDTSNARKDTAVAVSEPVQGQTDGTPAQGAATEAPQGQTDSYPAQEAAKEAVQGQTDSYPAQGAATEAAQGLADSSPAQGAVAEAVQGQTDSYPAQGGVTEAMPGQTVSSPAQGAAPNTGLIERDVAEQHTAEATDASVPAKHPGTSLEAQQAAGRHMEDSSTPEPAATPPNEAAIHAVPGHDTAPPPELLDVAPEPPTQAPSSGVDETSIEPQEEEPVVPRGSAEVAGIAQGSAAIAETPIDLPKEEPAAPSAAAEVVDDSQGLRAIAETPIDLLNQGPAAPSTAGEAVDDALGTPMQPRSSTVTEPTTKTLVPEELTPPSCAVAATAAAPLIEGTMLAEATQIDVFFPSTALEQAAKAASSDIPPALMAAQREVPLPASPAENTAVAAASPTQPAGSSIEASAAMGATTQAPAAITHTLEAVAMQEPEPAKVAQAQVPAPVTRDPSGRQHLDTAAVVGAGGAVLPSGTEATLPVGKGFAAEQTTSEGETRRGATGEAIQGPDTGDLQAVPIASSATPSEEHPVPPASGVHTDATAAAADDDALQEAAQAVVDVVDSAGEALEAAAQTVFAFLAGHAAPSDALTRRGSRTAQHPPTGIEEVPAVQPAATHQHSAPQQEPSPAAAAAAAVPPGGTPQHAGGSAAAMPAVPAGPVAAGSSPGGTAAASAQQHQHHPGTGGYGDEEDAYIPDIDELEVPEGSSTNGDGGPSGAGGYASRLLSSFLSRSLFGSTMLNDPSQQQHPPHHPDS